MKNKYIKKLTSFIEGVIINCQHSTLAHGISNAAKLGIEIEIYKSRGLFLQQNTQSNAYLGISTILVWCSITQILRQTSWRRRRKRRRLRRRRRRKTAASTLGNIAKQFPRICKFLTPLSSVFSSCLSYFNFTIPKMAAISAK